MTRPLNKLAGAAASTPAPVAASATPTDICSECEGTGFFIYGSFHPDDPRSDRVVDCENCGGTGEVEDDEGLTEIEHLGPGRIAA